MKSNGHHPYGSTTVPYQQQLYYHCQQPLSQAAMDDEMVTMIYSPTFPDHSPAPSVESERLMMTASYDLSGRPRFDYGGSGRRFSTSSSFRSRYSGSGGHHHHFFGGGGAHRPSKLSTTTVASSSTVDLRSPADVGDVKVAEKKVKYAKQVDSNNNRTASSLSLSAAAVQPARWKKIVKTVINTRCTEHLLWTTSSALGVLVLVAQVPPIFLRNWVHIIEPRPINRTNDKGEIVEVPFVFNVGYFRACRWLNVANWSAVGIYEETALLEVEDNYPERCVWNPIFTGEDLSDFSFATNAIMFRFLAPPILHVVGTLFTIMAFLFSLSGHFNRDAKTLSSAIIYFIGGLGVMAGVLQVVCVVDDEMYPRMKPNASGEPSTFAFHYGLSFLAAAFSFLPVQVCIYLQTSAFFSRFRNPVDKARVVPGLSKLLQQVTTIKCRTHLGKYSGLFNGNDGCRDGGAAAPRGDNEGDEEAAAVADGVGGCFPLSVSTSSIGGSIAGVSVNFAGRQRRESRAYSKDLSAACYGVHQEVRCVAPPLTESIVVRRPSYFQ